jgi:hypothetical protein
LPIFTRTKKHLLIQYLLALGSFHLYGFCDSSSLQVSSSFQGDPSMEGTKDVSNWSEECQWKIQSGRSFHSKFE